MFGKEKTVKILHIEGMSCSHCAATVEKKLSEIKGVSDASVDLDSKTAKVRLRKEVDDSVLTSAVDDAGFAVVSIDIQQKN
ncbi:MAG: heavy-metal-associated domain-containing protein [Clostridia bacterium]|nr:heavy-metal-associated domain-containing protein [Clostridia bacterium]